MRTTDSPSPRPVLRRARTRAGWRGLVAGVLLAVVFTAWPGIDLWVADRFHLAGRAFLGDQLAWVRALAHAVPVVGWSYVFASLAALVLFRRHPGALPWRWRRRAAALLLVSVLCSGLLVNAGLKSHWGRARPRDVAEVVGGALTPHRFTPALEPADQCARNCSFSSGHAASGFVIMAVGLMGPVATRRRWWRIGLALGLLASLGRVMQGAHFLSDTLFSGWFVWATGWALREAWLRRVAARRRAARAARRGEG